jgi:hypothetical protein
MGWQRCRRDVHAEVHSRDALVGKAACNDDMGRRREQPGRANCKKTIRSLTLDNRIIRVFKPSRWRADHRTRRGRCIYKLGILIMSSLRAFSVWLEATPLSLFIQTTTWIIPTVQTIHILSIAIVISAVLMVHLHTLGVAMRNQSGAQLAHRFLPWLWTAFLVLLLTGTILVIGEPGRSLPNAVFQLKMGLVIGAIVLTLFYQQPLRKDSGYWDKSRSRRASAITIAVASLCVWVGIVFAGRWIAYAIDG